MLLLLLLCDSFDTYLPLLQNQRFGLDKLQTQQPGMEVVFCFVDSKVRQSTLEWLSSQYENSEALAENGWAPFCSGWSTGALLHPPAYSGLGHRAKSATLGLPCSGSHSWSELLNPDIIKIQWYKLKWNELNVKWTSIYFKKYLLLIITSFYYCYLCF